jgi:hypothetical protein
MSRTPIARIEPPQRVRVQNILRKRVSDLWKGPYTALFREDEVCVLVILWKC